MAKASKIEKHGCEDIVAAGICNGDSVRLIAERCTEWAKESISHTTVARYIESMSNQTQREKKAVIVQDRRRLLKTVNQELDIIQLQYDMTSKLAARFDMIDNLPEYFKEQMDELIEKMSIHDDFDHVSYLESWQSQLEKELKRKIFEITSLNRELRENSKFLAELREKAFEFSLVQEYLFLFMEEFRKENANAYEATIQRIAANPRMQRIVEQQQQMRGE